MTQRTPNTTNPVEVRRAFNARDGDNNGVASALAAAQLAITELQAELDALQAEVDLLGGDGSYTYSFFKLLSGDYLKKLDGYRLRLLAAPVWRGDSELRLAEGGRLILCSNPSYYLDLVG